MSIDLPPGTAIAGDRYKLLERLDAGREGHIWRALHVPLDRPVILKRYKLMRRLVDGNGERFLRSLRAHADLEHPHIVAVLDGGFDEHGHAFVVMPTLRGETLEARLRRGPLGFAEAANIFGQLCEALGAAHARVVVHRDLKPSNIFLAAEGSGQVAVKLLDFGVALTLEAHLADRPLTPPGILYGSPHYMAPEQYQRPDLVCPPTDVWALGVVLHEALLGRRPFSGKTMLDLLSERAELRWDRAMAPALPKRWALAIEGCLQPSTVERFPTAAELGAAIRQRRPDRLLKRGGAALAALGVVTHLGRDELVVPLLTGNLGSSMVFHSVWTPVVSTGALLTTAVGIGLYAFAHARQRAATARAAFDHDASGSTS